MKQIQLLFDETLQIEKDKKYKMDDYKNLLSENIEYNNLKEEIKSLRDKKKRIEENALAECGIEIDDINREIRGNKEMLSDIAITQLMDKGKVEKISDEYGNEYEPVIKVSFKKVRK